jgi:hypothetical protein
MYKTIKVTFFHKTVVCLLTGILTAYTIKRFNPAYLPNWLPKIAIPITIWLLLIASLLFIAAWQVQERKNRINSTSVLAFFQAVLIYFLAFDFTKWALLKFLHLHMTTSLGWMEMPMTMLSGEQQLSHFFGQNYPMVIAFGVCEISGAILILFRKTRLVGAFILFVMCTNIALMDFLYNVKDPFPEVLLLLCAVVYIALQDYHKIKNFFFRATTSLPEINFNNEIAKNIIRISAIVIPLLILIPHYEIQFRPNLTGKYKITGMTVNGKEILIDTCNDSIISHVYFDLGDHFIMMSDNFINRKVGRFKFNESTRQFKTVWQYPKELKDTLYARVSVLDKENRMLLSGIMGNDTLNMELLKVKVKSVTTTY